MAYFSLARIQRGWIKSFPPPLLERLTPRVLHLKYPLSFSSSSQCQLLPYELHLGSLTTVSEPSPCSHSPPRSPLPAKHLPELFLTACLWVSLPLPERKLPGATGGVLLIFLTRHRYLVNVCRINKYHMTKEWLFGHFFVRQANASPPSDKDTKAAKSW